MGQKLRSKGSLTSSFILISCGILAFILGASMLMRYPEGIWWIGLPLVFSAILVAFSAIRIYYFTQKENKLVNEQLSSLNTKPEEKQISRKSKF